MRRVMVMAALGVAVLASRIPFRQRGRYAVCPVFLVADCALAPSDALRKLGCAHAARFSSGP